MSTFFLTGIFLQLLSCQRQGIPGKNMQLSLFGNPSHATGVIISHEKSGFPLHVLIIVGTDNRVQE